jgi:precorrin-3B synthase
MSAAARTDFRRGACPGLSKPMQTGDGLLARLMPTGTITLDAMAGLSAAALNYGNRIIEITSRGSIQVRGLTAESAPAFAEAVAALGIPAHDGVPVIADPLAGLDPGEVIDAGALAAELRAALARQPFTRQLAPKVSIAIDGGGDLHLESLPADIRLRAVATPDGPRFHLAIGGDAASALSLGTVAPADAIDEVLRLLRTVAAHGPDARARDVIRVAPTAAPAPPRRPVDPIGVHRLRGKTVALGIGLAFGHTDTTMLNRLLRAARAAGATGLRTAPGRALLIVGIVPPDVARIAAALDRLDVVTDPRDPRRRVIACAGAPICASGEIAARELAPAVARDAAGLMQGRETIHISGCAKMCAYQGDATLTAIGRAGACDLLVDAARAGRCEPEQLAGRLAHIAGKRLQKKRHG